MSRAELDTRLEWAREQEGYNVGVHDGDALYTVDPDGFIGLDIDGTLEGCIAAVRYSSEFAFIGLYIVRDAVTLGAAKERLGVVRLLQAGLERVDGSCVGLEATGAREEQYIRWGKFRPVWRSVRQIVDIEDARLAAGTSLPASRPGEPIDSTLIPARQAAFEQLAAYDALHFGARRDAFLQQWITLPGHEAWACVQGAERRVRGFAVIRPGHVGRQIGPLFADDAEVAEALLRQLLSGVESGSVLLDTPDANADAMALARRYGMQPWCTTKRMYRDGEPSLPVRHLFGLTTQELG